jgi:2-polyprenyl-6-methoxyphenol hydroxylase-like FAD-dependent oxidoreductase
MSNQTDTAGSAVVIIGAGPTGLFLAGELAATGVRPIVLERATQPVQTPKGNGVVGRSVVELRKRNLLRGTALRVVRPPRFRFGSFALELGLLRSPLHILAIPQWRLEALLEERAVRLGATVLRGIEVTAFEQDEGGVTIQASRDGSDVNLRTRYLVGCDGAHSLVRKRLGIGFPGITSTAISRQARVTIPAAVASRTSDRINLAGVGRLPLFQPHRTERGSITIAPVRALDPSALDDLYIVSTHESRGDAEPTDQLSDDELRDSLRRVLGADLPYTTASAARSVVANSRHAPRYREGRVFIAGDAAHIFSAGGSAINAGLLDGIALATTFATALAGDKSAKVMDAYQAQRHPANERTLALTRFQHDLEAADESGDALRVIFGELLKSRANARRIATLIEG